MDAVLQAIDADHSDLIDLCLALGDLRDYSGEEREVGPGELIYIPAEIVHSVDVLPGEDAKFFTCKDLRHGIAGTRVD